MDKTVFNVQPREFGILRQIHVYVQPLKYYGTQSHLSANALLGYMAQAVFHA